MDSPISTRSSSAFDTSIESEISDLDVSFDLNTFKIISIEGNIGSGKSTLLANLKQRLGNHPNVIFLKEPVDEWETIKDKDGQTMLQKFYANQERYSFSFQMMAYITRLDLLRNTIKEHPNAIIITERSLYTDKYVFAKMLYESNKIEDVNYQIYLKWFDSFVSDCPIHQVIYVKTQPKICFERIIKRSRKGESGIPLEYLQDCHNYHENMLDVTKYEKDEKPISENQLVIDGDVDIYEDKNELDSMIDRVLNFINVSVQ